ncbi:MAG: hypothetical protein RJA34_491 [Pseudomonadota bacterium]|jgi:predicted RecA/RadA family phage recombinase
MKLKRSLAAATAAGLACSLCLPHAQAQGLKQVGDLLALGLPLAAAGTSAYEGDTDGLAQLAKAEALTLGATLALKSATHQTRPNGRDDQSFPSGHSSVAFAAAQYLQSRKGWAYGAPAYAAAGLVAYSRVDAKEHYWRDVAAGAALGAGVSYWLTDAQPKSGAVSVSILPNAAWLHLRRDW